jgi:hypothetical protein
MATRSGTDARSTTIVRPIETPRAQASARAMEDTSIRLGQQLTAAVGQPMWARLYGFSVLEADDAHGHSQGLVVQHDRIRWADVLAVAAFAAPQIDPDDHPGAACRDIAGGCPACRARQALARLRTAWSISGLDLATVTAAVSVGATGLGTPPFQDAAADPAPVSPGRGPAQAGPPV